MPYYYTLGSVPSHATHCFAGSNTALATSMLHKTGPVGNVACIVDVSNCGLGSDESF